MFKTFFSLTLLLSFALSDNALILQKGWQMVGSSSDIDDMHLFKSEDVEQIWHYDASTQKWRGYSPDPTIAKKIIQKGYEPIQQLKSYHGFWVKSKQEWVLVSPSSEKRGDTIMLKKGWNLISLPVDTIVSPHIFDGKTLWKYTTNQKWCYFDEKESIDYPKITHISNADAIWVKSNEDQNISVVASSAKLHNFSNKEEMKSYIKEMLLTNQRPYMGYYPLMPMARVVDTAVNSNATTSQTEDSSTKLSAPQTAQNSSQTNLQESGVDEADIVKHDNQYLYYLYRQDMGKTSLYINSFANIVQGKTKPIQTLPIEGSVKSLYLSNNRLILIGINGYPNYKVESVTKQESTLFVPSMFVEIYNVSDKEHPQKITRYNIDGQIQSSRMIGSKLFLITTFTPQIFTSYPKLYVDAPECKEFFQEPAILEGGMATATNEVAQNTTPTIDLETTKKYAKCYTLAMDEKGRFYRYDYDHPKITQERLTPTIQKEGEKKRDLLEPNNFFAPSKSDQFPSITTVTQIDIQSTNVEKTSTILGQSDTLYASNQSLYIVSSQYPLFYGFDRYEERSVIYRFALSKELSYASYGFVKGRVLNQFSLSEYNQILRIATTEGNSWQNNTKNTLYTLKEKEQKLYILGTLSGLGKEGETIQAVRFLGDKGYIITFKQRDPLYSIDLRDPLNPKKAAALEIDGFSAYLHPISNTQLLGIGRDATPTGEIIGLKIELFDIADIYHPQTLDSYSFGNAASYAEILNNHKALAYRESDKLFAFSYQEGYQQWESKLGVFQIQNDTILSYQPLQAPSTYTDALQRGVIFDYNNRTYVAYIVDGEINYAPLETLK